MFRARVAVRRVEASARSRQGARAHFPESRNENAEDAQRGGVHSERGQDAQRNVCAMVKATRVLPSGFSFIAINTSERAPHVPNDACRYRPSSFLSRLHLFFILFDRRSYVHS